MPARGHLLALGPDFKAPHRYETALADIGHGRLL
jgi:hypothetical protein